MKKLAGHDFEDLLQVSAALKMPQATDPNFRSALSPV
jgi:hypothetical protein